MFGLFSKKNNNSCPIDPDMRLWMEQAFLWLATQFGRDNIATKPMLLPTPEHFPIRYDGSKESLLKTGEIIARQMEVDMTEINLDIYEQNIQEFSGGFGHRIWTEVDIDSGEKLASGLYFDKNGQGQYDILIEKKNLNDPENLVATLAHEFSHIKLLGEKRLDSNDEQLTDLTPVVFGLGIFNANACFKEHKTFDSYGHNSIGYLKQREWGYALALYAFFRQEENPDWIKFLTPNIKSDFKKSLDFIHANTDTVFIEEHKENNHQQQSNMNLLSKLFNRQEIDCPRCLGKGNVDLDDIKRLNKELRWLPGKCAYCNGTGKVASKMVSKVSADNAYLTIDISEEERRKLFNADEGALQRAKYRDDQFSDLIKQIEYLHFIGNLDANKIADFYLSSNAETEISSKERQELLQYAEKVINKKKNKGD